MDNKSKIILLASIITLSIIISGCADGGQDITPVFKSLPEIQQFLQENPNAKITVTYWTEEEVTEISDEISIQCDKNINPRALYKATISEGNVKIISWIDAETQIIICTVTQGFSDSTPTATATPTPTPTPTATVSPQEYIIRIQSYMFIPVGDQTINVGDKITWRNFEENKQARVLISEDGIWPEEQYLSYMQSVSYTFNEPGIYTFYLKGRESKKCIVNVS